MFCENCGNNLTENSKFCDKCGHIVNDDSVSAIQKKDAPIEKNIIPNKYDKKPLLIVISIIIGVFIIVSIINNFSNSESTQQSDNTNLKQATGMDGQINNTKFERISETVVNILCPYSSEPFSIDSNGTGGSGTILDSSGLVISNSHIVPQNESVLDVSEKGCFVILPDIKTGAPKEIYLATPLVFNDLSDEYDLAFFTIYDAYKDEDGQYGQYPKDFPSFDDTNSCKDERIKLGESVRILGYPVSSGGYNLTITNGIVSSFSDDGLILTSAKVDQGNSGGLAIDKDGCMIGIPTSISEGEYDKLGVIIPASKLVDFMNKVNQQIN